MENYAECEYFRAAGSGRVWNWLVGCGVAAKGQTAVTCHMKWQGPIVWGNAFLTAELIHLPHEVAGACCWGALCSLPNFFTCRTSPSSVPTSAGRLAGAVTTVTGAKQGAGRGNPQHPVNCRTSSPAEQAP